MSTDFEALIADTLEALKDTGSEFWDRIQEDQKPQVTESAGDMAYFYGQLLTAKTEDEKKQAQRDINQCISVLEGNAVLAEIRAAKRIKQALEMALSKALKFGFAALAAII